MDSTRKLLGVEILSRSFDETPINDVKGKNQTNSQGEKYFEFPAQVNLNFDGESDFDV